MLSLRSLSIFSSWPGIGVSKVVVLRRLLVHLTSGEALGFSRAVFLELDEIAQNLVYVAGLGSITPWRHVIVTQRAREEGLQRLIERADELVDQELDDVMRDVCCGAEEPIVKALLGQEIAQEISTSVESPWPEAMKDLVRRLGTHKVIAAPVRTAKKVFGLLV